MTSDLELEGNEPVGSIVFIIEEYYIHTGRNVIRVDTLPARKNNLPALYGSCGSTADVGTRAYGVGRVTKQYPSDGTVVVARAARGTEEERSLLEEAGYPELK